MKMTTSRARKDATERLQFYISFFQFVPRSEFPSVEPPELRGLSGRFSRRERRRKKFIEDVSETVFFHMLVIRTWLAAHKMRPHITVLMG